MYDLYAAGATLARWRRRSGCTGDNVPSYLSVPGSRADDPEPGRTLINGRCPRGPGFRSRTKAAVAASRSIMVPTAGCPTQMELRPLTRQDFRLYERVYTDRRM